MQILLKLDELSLVLLSYDKKIQKIRVVVVISTKVKRPVKM